MSRARANSGSSGSVSSAPRLLHAGEPSELSLTTATTYHSSHSARPQLRAAYLHDSSSMGLAPRQPRADRPPSHQELSPSISPRLGVGDRAGTGAAAAMSQTRLDKLRFEPAVRFALIEPAPAVVHVVRGVFHVGMACFAAFFLGTAARREGHYLERVAGNTYPSGSGVSTLLQLRFWVLLAAVVLWGVSATADIAQVAAKRVSINYAPWSLGVLIVRDHMFYVVFTCAAVQCFLGLTYVIRTAVCVSFAFGLPFVFATHARARCSGMQYLSYSWGQVQQPVWPFALVNGALLFDLFVTHHRSRCVGVCFLARGVAMVAGSRAHIHACRTGAAPTCWFPPPCSWRSPVCLCTSLPQSSMGLCLGSVSAPVPRRASRLRCFACKLRGADVPCAVIRADMGVQRPIHMARVHLRRVFGAWSRCIFSVAWLDLARPGRHELLPSAIRRSVGACGVETRHQLQGHRVRDRSGMPVCCVALCS